MRVRKQDANGDYVIGGGETDFYVNSPEGVAQSVETRLGLWEGEWFLDKTEGTPWSQEVLGYQTAALRDLVIRARILGTSGVTSIYNYSSTTNSSRQLVVSGSIITQFSTQPTNFGPVTL